MLFAAKLFDLITSRRLNQKEVAELLDKHPSEISKWLSGTHNFTLDTIFEIEDKIGIDLINLEQKKPDKCLFVITKTFDNGIGESFNIGKSKSIIPQGVLIAEYEFSESTISRVQ